MPDVIKMIKDNGGEYIAGGFNKTKLMHGTQTVGNRFVVIRFPNEAAYMKAQSDGVKAWLDKYLPSYEGYLPKLGRRNKRTKNRRRAARAARRFFENKHQWPRSTSLLPA